MSLTTGMAVGYDWLCSALLLILIPHGELRALQGPQTQDKCICFTQTPRGIIPDGRNRPQIPNWGNGFPFRFPSAPPGRVNKCGNIEYLLKAEQLISPRPHYGQEPFDNGNYNMNINDNQGNNKFIRPRPNFEYVPFYKGTYNMNPNNNQENDIFTRLRPHYGQKPFDNGNYNMNINNNQGNNPIISPRPQYEQDPCVDGTYNMNLHNNPDNNKFIRSRPHFEHVPFYKGTYSTNPNNNPENNKFTRPRPHYGQEPFDNGNYNMNINDNQENNPIISPRPHYRQEPCVDETNNMNLHNNPEKIKFIRPRPNFEHVPIYKGTYSMNPNNNPENNIFTRPKLQYGQEPFNNGNYNMNINNNQGNNPIISHRPHLEQEPFYKGTYNMNPNNNPENNPIINPRPHFEQKPFDKGNYNMNINNNAEIIPIISPKPHFEQEPFDKGNYNMNINNNAENIPIISPRPHYEPDPCVDGAHNMNPNNNLENIPIINPRPHFGQEPFDKGNSNMNINDNQGNNPIINPLPHFGQEPFDKGNHNININNNAENNPIISPRPHYVPDPCVDETNNMNPNNNLGNHYIDNRTPHTMQAPKDLQHAIDVILNRFRAEGCMNVLPHGATSMVIDKVIELMYYMYEVKHVPKHLIQFILKTPMEILQPIILALENIMPRIQPDLILQYILVLKQKNSSGTQQNKMPIEQTFGKLKCTRPDTEEIRYCINNPDTEVAIDILTELYRIIIGITNKQLIDTSPKVQEFILHNSNLHQAIIEVIEDCNIPVTNLNPLIIEQLLKSIFQYKTDGTLPTISQDIINILANLDGAQDITEAALRGIQENEDFDITQVMLQIMNNVGNFPQNLREWLLHFPDGEKLLEYLQTPGEIECTEPGYSKVHCTKILVENEGVAAPIGLPNDIITELQKVILELANNELIDMSPQLHKFILSCSNIHQLITKIIEDLKIPLNPLIVEELLMLLSKYKTNATIQDISPGLIKFMMNLRGAEDLTNFALNWILKNKNIDMLQMALQIVYDNGGKIPENLRAWLLHAPNGQKVLEFLEKPGKIECIRHDNNKVHCNNILIEAEKIAVPLEPPGIGRPDTGPSRDIMTELYKVILGLNNNELIGISPELQKFILICSNIHKIIMNVIEQHKIPLTNVNPLIIEELLILLSKYKTNATIQDISPGLIKFLMNLRGAEDLTKFVLNWILKNKNVDMLQMVLQIVYDNGDKIIPENLRAWLIHTNNGQILEFLEKPGEIECIPQGNNKVHCNKILIEAEKVAVPMERPDSGVPKDIMKELYELILGLSNNELIEISPQLQKFILNYSSIHELIIKVIEDHKIPVTNNVNPLNIEQLIKLIIDFKTNTTIHNIAPNLIKFIINLRGAEEFTMVMLNWIQGNKNVDILQMVLQIVYDNGGKIIPENLRAWLSHTPDGQKILELIEKPGEIQCTQQDNNKVQCSKILEEIEEPNVPKEPHDTPLATDITTELYEVILGITNNDLIDISPKLQKFILHYSNLHQLIIKVIEEHKIPVTNVNPLIIEQLLMLITKYKTNSTIHDISPDLIKFVMNLHGAEDLTKVVFNWIQGNKNIDMVQLFLQIVKDNGGKIIPENLRAWLLSFSNGQKILEYLEKPGEIECKQQGDNKIHCSKIFIANEEIAVAIGPSNTGLPMDIMTELNTVILGLTNNKLIDISPKLQQFILHYSNLHQLIIKVIEDHNIPVTNVNPLIIEQLLMLITKYKTSSTIQDISPGLIKFLIKLNGAEELTKVVFNWFQKNKHIDMMQLFLQIVQDNGGKIIPPNLRAWLLDIPNGRNMLKFLEKPGEIRCTPQGNNKIHCTKILIHDEEIAVPMGYDSTEVSLDILAELNKVILGITNHELIDISPKLQQFILHSSNLHQLIMKIYQEHNYSATNVNPLIIEQLLMLITKYKTNGTIRDLSPSLIKFVMNLRGAEDLTKVVFHWFETNKNVDMMQMFLQIVNENGGKIIPPNLYAWLLHFPNGQKILEFLEKPGEIKCIRQGNDTVSCTKIVYTSTIVHS